MTLGGHGEPQPPQAPLTLQLYNGISYREKVVIVSYRIVCTDQEPAGAGPHDAHIVGVGTGTDPDSASMHWTLDRVLAALDRGEYFYTQGKHSGKVARVLPWNCSYCGRRTIRSSADAVTDNNLDSLRYCSWSR
jgi:hypothetical protein